MLEEKYVWFKTGQVCKKTENNFSILHGELPKGVYRPVCNKLGEWSLECLSDEFVFNFKMYNIEDKFINHVLKTWNNTSKNLGIMLTGVKGTGKSIIGKQLANAVNLPVILVECPEKGDPAPVMDYLKTIDFECVFFFDEYEKGFKDGNEILTLMDGMYSDLSRKLFILTTNNMYINNNLISRPSRIRYFKKFGNLSSDFILSYLNDALNDKSRTKEILNFVTQLKNCTIDILKAIVEEINLHNCDVKTVQEYMNLTKETVKFNVYSGYKRYFDSLESFIEACSKIGEIKDSKDDIKQYYTPSDLSVYSEIIESDKQFKDLEIGDFIDKQDWEIIDIKGNYIEAKDYENTVCYYKICNPDVTPSLYDFIY